MNIICLLFNLSESLCLICKMRNVIIAPPRVILKVTGGNVCRVPHTGPPRGHHPGNIRSFLLILGHLSLLSRSPLLA